MKQYCLIGETIEYSLSPLLHNTLFSLSGINAEYTLMPCALEDLAQACDQLRAKYAGANVTVPYKQSIMPFLDEVVGDAPFCGAVNTVLCTPDKLVGDSTDGYGFLRSVDNIRLKGGHVLLLGGGGVARSILAQLLRAGAVVDILNRSRKNATLMLEELAAAGVDCFGARLVENPLRNYTMVINATPLGGAGNEQKSPLEDLSCVGYIMDCVYSPARTLLLRTGEEADVPGKNGLDMLFWQGIHSQALWGNRFSDDILRQTYEILKAENQRRG